MCVSLVSSLGPQFTSQLDSLIKVKEGAEFKIGLPEVESDLDYTMTLTIDDEKVPAFTVCEKMSCPIYLNPASQIQGLIDREGVSDNFASKSFLVKVTAEDSYGRKATLQFILESQQVNETGKGLQTDLVNLQTGNFDGFDEAVPMIEDLKSYFRNFNQNLLQSVN